MKAAICVFLLALLANNAVEARKPQTDALSPQIAVAEGMECGRSRFDSGDSQRCGRRK